MFAFKRCPACHSIHEPTAVCAARSRQQHLQEQRDEKRSEAFEADHGARTKPLESLKQVLAETPVLATAVPGVIPRQVFDRAVAALKQVPHRKLERQPSGVLSVTDKKPTVTDKRDGQAKSQAQRAADYRAKNGEVKRAADTERKRVARAAKGQDKKCVATARKGHS